MKFEFPLTPRQQKLVDSQATTLVCGAGTKTGKSMASYIWLIRGLLSGQACCFCGPWFFRSRAAFDAMKVLLQPFIASRTVKINEARLQLTAVGGGYCDFVSADNPNALYGGNYDRLVLDEASRMPSEIYAAALTTISATHGKLRLFFNLDLGVRNWAIKQLLRIQALSPEDRERTGEDFLMFPSGGDGLVSDELIQQFKAQMPLPLWEALYLAKIPDSDCSLFRNLDKIFTGHERETSAEGVRYYLGVDLARKKDFTSATVISEQGDVVAMLRFSQMDWSLQVGKIALLYRTFGCSKCVADSTGLGDPVCEQLEDLGLEVERYVFTTPSRKALLEELILACDNREFTVPATSKFEIYRQELESFEYVLDGMTAKYEAPGHDDTTISLALAVHGFRGARGAILGYIVWLQRHAKDLSDGIRDKFGELIHKPSPAPKPAAPAAAAPQLPQASSKPAPELLPFCSVCKNVRLVKIGSMPGRDLHCNTCGADHDRSGNLVAKPSTVTVGVDCCEDAFIQNVSGSIKCGACGLQSNGAPQARQMSKAQYDQLKNKPWWK